MSSTAIAEPTAPVRTDAARAEGPTPPGPRPRRTKRRRHPWLRRVLVVFLVLITPLAWSYYRALTYPGSAGWEMATVEWLRDHGAGGTVDNVEVWLYTRHHPPTSGRPSGALPAMPSAAQIALVARERSSGLLPSVSPTVKPTMPGEAVWRPGRVGPGGHPAIYTTWFRPDPGHPTLVAGALVIDQSESRLDLVAGTKDPGGGPWPGDAQVSVRHRSSTVAAFNSGFLMRGAHGGFFENGQSKGRLRRYQASLVIMRDGRAFVGEWGRDFHMSNNVWAVRQNLAPIVDHGRAVKGLTRNTHFRWGTRKSQLEYVWRSGVGVDAQGRLIYIAGNHFTLTTLAKAFVQAHAVRAMELDIHNDMVTANLFTPLANGTNGVHATKLLPAMPRPAKRYLQPDQRDFFTVMLRR